MAEVNFKKLSREMAGRDGLSGSAIMFALFLTIGFILTWAAWAELDNVTRGEGRIISSAQNQVIQAAEGGVILRRFVRENSHVQKGDVLFEIDPIDANTELNILEQRLTDFEIKERRLRSEIDDETFDIPEILKTKSPSVATSETNLFTARRTELKGSISVLEQRRIQRDQDLVSTKNSRDTAKRTAEFLRQEIDLVTPLVEENIAPATRLLELKRQLEQAHGDQNHAISKIDQIQSAVREIDSQIENTYAEYRLRALEELNALIAEKNQINKSLPRLKERISRTVIRAPMAGVVSKLNFHTEGGYVKTGDAMLELVPTDEALIIEAKIQPKDISQIRLDDTVRIRFSAYDSAKYGTVDGRVIRISPDAVLDPQGRGSSHYLVDVAIEGSLILKDTGKKVTFLPGMTATVDVLSGSRTVLEYFWQPIARVQELALRD